MYRNILTVKDNIMRTFNIEQFKIADHWKESYSIVNTKKVNDEIYADLKKPDGSLYSSGKITFLLASCVKFQHPMLFLNLVWVLDSLNEYKEYNIVEQFL